MSNEVDLRKQRKVEADITIGDEISIKQQLAPNKTVVNIPASTTDGVLQASSTLRRELTIVNNSNGILYVLYGSGTTSTNYTHKLSKGDSLHVDDYRGAVSGIFTSAIGFTMVTETYY